VPPQIKSETFVTLSIKFADQIAGDAMSYFLKTYNEVTRVVEPADYY